MARQLCTGLAPRERGVSPTAAVGKGSAAVIRRPASSSELSYPAAATCPRKVKESQELLSVDDSSISIGWMRQEGPKPCEWCISKVSPRTWCPVELLLSEYRVVRGSRGQKHCQQHQCQGLGRWLFGFDTNLCCKQQHCVKRRMWRFMQPADMMRSDRHGLARAARSNIVRMKSLAPLVNRQRPQP